jgi:shikimate kinase
MKERERILITGFMGAGKTTVAAALARRLGCRMIDLDHFIAAREGRSVRAIIVEDGEARFRALETRALGQVLLDREVRVVALGGGTWIQEENRSLVAKHKGFVIWLDAPFELCWQRIARSAGVRPLAEDHAQARQLYDARRVRYGLAHLRIEAGEEKSAEMILAEIVSSLG